jgi:uncharacterized protein
MSITDRFNASLDALVAQITTDRSILAAMLCGSLSHDTVWEKSDIDLVLVTIDDKAADRESLALDAEGVNVHAFLLTRTEFRKTVEGTVRNSFVHSLMAKGRLLYSHDASITALVANLAEIGERDRRLQLLVAAMAAIGSLHKARKWLVTRGDLDYSALWLLYAATPLAQIELLDAHRLVGREVIPEAAALNPQFFKYVYDGLLGKRNTEAAIRASLDAADAYITARVPSLFGLVLDHLREVGEARSATEIDTHFSRHFGLPHVTTACEYLADSGIIGRATTPVRLTRRSNIDVQELAFFAYS